MQTTLQTTALMMWEHELHVGVEIGDGVIGHPMWSRNWAVNQMGPVRFEIDKRLQTR